MKFCPACAHPLTFAVPPDDNLPRHICENCGAIFYDNPKLVVGTVPYWVENGETTVLLCKRAIEPRYGMWTLPGGFMENKETTAEAAMRETSEEAGANIDVEPLFTLLNLPAFHQVHLFYRARLIDLQFNPGKETLEARMFREADIPWDQIAFATVRHTLQFFFADVHRIRSEGGSFGFHSHDVMITSYTGT